MAKNTGCSSKEHKYDMQHPHGSSQTSVILVLVDSLPASAFCGQCTHIVLDALADKAHT